MRTPVGLAVAVLMGLGALQAFSHRETPPLAATQLAVERMQLNTLNQSKAGLVAGGELGTMLYSTDLGKHWLPAKVSNNRQALVNQISFASDGMEGMAVGHEGWILHTTDGGLNWTEVAFDEKNGEPLMGIARIPSGAWIAVGAFGRALRSNDQGATWEPLALPESVEDKHMNRIVGSADGKRGRARPGAALHRQWRNLGRSHAVLQRLALQRAGFARWRLACLRHARQCVPHCWRRCSLDCLRHAGAGLFLRPFPAARRHHCAGRPRQPGGHQQRQRRALHDQPCRWPRQPDRPAAGTRWHRLAVQRRRPAALFGGCCSCIRCNACSCHSPCYSPCPSS